MAHLKKNAACFCGRACVYHLIRCDVCHRGVHFACIGMTLAEAAQKKVFICGACEDTVQKENVAEQLNAEGRPDGSPSRYQYDDGTLHPDEVLSKARCDVCDHRCTFDFIQCDECEAWCHYVCAEMTPKLAASIDKWHCRPCLEKEDVDLKITYKHDRDAIVLPQKESRSVVRQLKQHAEPAGAGNLRKKTRLDATPRGFHDEPRLELNLEGEHELARREDEFELYLSDASELELDLDDEAELETDVSELDLDLDDEPELKREDDAELQLDLENDPELELKLADDNELKEEQVLENDIKDEPCSWT